MESVFTNIYETSFWGNNNNKEYAGSSGGGSSIEYNKDTYIPFLKKYIQDNNIKTVVDLGCGDFRCGKIIYDTLEIIYTGYDTYNKVIHANSKEYIPPKYTFIHLDFFTNKDKLINSDMCILKDVLQHWSLNNIYTFLDYLVESKKFKHILIINCSNNQVSDNTDIPDGGTRSLSCDYLPLKKYNPRKLYVYSTKEVSVIHCY